MPTFPTRPPSTGRAIFTAKLTLDPRVGPYYTNRNGEECHVGPKKHFSGRMVRFDDGEEMFALTEELEFLF